MLSNIFSSRKVNSEQKDRTFKIELETYLKSCTQFSSVESTQEGVQFNVGENGRVTINIRLLGNKYDSHSIKRYNGTTTTHCKVTNPSDLKQVMKSVYEQIISFLKAGTNTDKDVVSMLNKERRNLSRYNK